MPHVSKKQTYLDGIAEAHVEGWITFGCIPAPGYRNHKGYGVIQLHTGDGGQLARTAQNYVLRKAVGPPPSGYEAAHTCRSKGCCNVAHLAWKSGKDNQADRYRDGTDGAGTSNTQAKLTEAEVLEIRRLYAGGGWTHERLAERYGVSGSTISRIITRKLWPHLVDGAD